MTVRMGITTEQQRNNNKHGNIRNNKLVVTLLWFRSNKKGDVIEYSKRSEQLFENTCSSGGRPFNAANKMGLNAPL